MALSFDHTTSRIRVSAPQVALTIQELVNACRLEEERDLTKKQIISASGKEALSSGVAVGITATLLRDWQIEWWPGNYTATISGGNIVAESGDPVAYVVGGPQVEITLSAAATITAADGSAAGPSAAEIASAVWAAGPSTGEIAAAVWQRVIEGSISAEGMLRTLLAFGAGKATLPSGPGAFTFRDQADTKNRISGTVDESGNRVITGVDPT